MKGCRYQYPRCEEPLVSFMFCQKHLEQVEAEIPFIERFNCSRCRVWLRNRPELTDTLIGEAHHANVTRDATGRLPHSVVGKNRMVEGVLSIASTEVLADGERRETLRFCPSCALVAKDALLELGFTLGIS